MRHIWQRPLKDILAGIVFIMVICLLVFSAIWAYREYLHTPPYVDEEKYPVRGIDISRHNGEVDFERVKNSGVEFVFIKASEGVSHTDSLYHRNLTSAEKAGLKAGAYHFFRFDSNGIDQAQNFLTQIGSHTPELGLVVDVESTGNPEGIPIELIKERLIEMVEYLNLAGHRVMIYTNLDGYYDYMADTLPGYPLWICRFKQDPIYAEWTFWQYDHHGRVDGINGDVDLNVFCGSRDDWQRYLSGELWPYTGK